jgi:hypothetical protein
MYLGLHLGVVFHGNIGSKERLDFTVVGPAVNEVARIAALCRSVDQPILASSAFAASVAEDRRRFASVGRFALRGVGEPQELFTLDTQGFDIAAAGNDGWDNTGAPTLDSVIMASAKPSVKHMPMAPTPRPPHSACAFRASARSHSMIGLDLPANQTLNSRWIQMADSIDRNT